MKKKWRKLSHSSKFLLLLFLLACTMSPVDLEIERGEKSELAKEYDKAATHFTRAIKRESSSDLSLYAAKKLANLSLIHLDDIKQAKYALNYIITHTKSTKDKKDALERLAKIEYEKLKNYEQAIVQFQRLLSIENNKQKRIEILYLIARSYFYMNRLYQAQQELDTILSLDDKNNTSDQMFRVLTMQANIYHAGKKYQKAVDLYKTILNRFPEKSLKQNVWLNLSLCYEDMKQFDLAIDLLEEIQMNLKENSFVGEKISRLKNRRNKEPGARGLRK